MGTMASKLQQHSPISLFFFRQKTSLLKAMWRRSNLPLFRRSQGHVTTRKSARRCRSQPSLHARKLRKHRVAVPACVTGVELGHDLLLSLGGHAL